MLTVIFNVYSLENYIYLLLNNYTGRLFNYKLFFYFSGKKLQCPYCERLYGYETNLRAHIRQRHQGIRVPCPFCARTFTRNNTVRRHIAREHKTEIAVKSNPTFPQTANHNQ